MGFYRDNALLQELKKISYALTKTWIPSIGEWMLIYGNAEYRPEFTCYVHEKYVGKSVIENEIRNQLQMVSHISIEILGVNNFQVELDDNLSLELDGSSLIQTFIQKSLIASGKPDWKGINSQSSSNYHLLQQRMNLFGGVTDIDLVKINSDKKNIFFELKRSYIDPDKWMPFRADAGGYLLLSEFAKINNGELLVVYWKRQQNPWFEDLSKIKILKYDEGSFHVLKYLNFTNFVEEYLLD